MVAMDVVEMSQRNVAYFVGWGTIKESKIPDLICVDAEKCDYFIKPTHVAGDRSLLQAGRRCGILYRASATFTGYILVPIRRLYAAQCP